MVNERFENHEVVEAVHTTTFYRTKNYTINKIYLQKLGLVFVQKIYIKYKNFKDGLCSKIACPFGVQKGRVDTGWIRGVSLGTYLKLTLLNNIEY